jgi:hypothetical protein
MAESVATRQMPIDRGFFAAIVLLCLLVSLGAMLSLPASAISTDPALMLTRVSADAGASIRVVRLDGVLPAEDLVQQPFPLQVLISERGGSEYVRYDLSMGAVVGSSAALIDGLEPAEVPALVSEGSPAPDARVVMLGRERIEVRLPDAFPAGPALAVFFTIHEGTPILSNAVAFEIEAIAP